MLKKQIISGLRIVSLSRHKEERRRKQMMIVRISFPMLVSIFPANVFLKGKFEVNHEKVLEKYAMFQDVKVTFILIHSVVIIV